MNSLKDNDAEKLNDSESQHEAKQGNVTCYTLELIVLLTSIRQDVLRHMYIKSI